MKKLIILLCLLFSIYKCFSQPKIVYANYIKNHCVDCYEYGKGGIHEFEVTVFFDKDQVIPDSIDFDGGITNIGVPTKGGYAKFAKTSQTNVCNNLTKVIYKTGLWFGGFPGDGSFGANAKFKNDTVKYKGQNVPDSLEHTASLIVTTYGHKYAENNSSYFKDIALVTIEKGKSNTINLFDKDDDNDSLIFTHVTANDNKLFLNQIANIVGVKLNTKTGDLSIPNNIDTGYYTLSVGVRDYFKTDSFQNLAFQSYTFFIFTLYVTNEKNPYFIHSKTAKKDTMGINYLSILPTDKNISYQLDYINPKGLGNYSVAIPSVKQFKIPQTYTATKINDTTLRINITINLTGTYYLDTFWYRKVRELPNSITVIITTTDSLGNCKQDLTSFYVTNNTSSSTNELTDINRITIFPNPATNKINIVFEGNVPQNLIANIYDSKGSLVKTETLINNEIDINNLAQGLYLLTIVSEGKRYNSKFVKE
jgi:hypothetical protein